MTKVNSTISIKNLILPWCSQAPYQPSIMGLGKRRRWSRKGRDQPQVDGQTLYPSVWNNRTSKRKILQDPGCALPETSINQSQEGLTKFYSTFADFSTNRTGSMPAHKLLRCIRGRSGPTSPASLWSHTWRTKSHTTNRVWCLHEFTWRTKTKRKTTSINPWATLLPQIPPRNPDLQAKNISRNWPRNPIMITYQNILRPQGRVT